MYRCEFCSASFPSYYSLRSHKNGSTTDGVPKCAIVDSETINVSPDAADDVSMHSAVVDIKTSIFCNTKFVNVIRCILNLVLRAH